MAGTISPDRRASITGSKHQTAGQRSDQQCFAGMMHGEAELAMCRSTPFKNDLLGRCGMSRDQVAWRGLSW
eukprot:m.139793 g.139793  ORF g.139793 m.139793 type:complete len:71 (-) comp15957_c0_seq2:172-384(-)